ncbi:hypothetical protein [Streptomyces sp. NBC_00658]|uniref:hypothetical protein n=1 Tax=Streptomyces sp. NBC_00658 TaxID=2975800 RepID=UPI003245A328
MTLLQPHRGPVDGDRYLPADPAAVHWGLLPNARSKPTLSVPSGTSVSLDTISHEGILADQGRDPAAFFAAAGIHGILRCRRRSAQATPTAV